MFMFDIIQSFIYKVIKYTHSSHESPFFSVSVMDNDTCIYASPH